MLPRSLAARRSYPWLLRQKGKEISYHLYLGEKHYSWIVVGEEEEDDE